MLGILTFAISIMLIGICFAAAIATTSQGRGTKKNVLIPEIVQWEFREFADDLLAKESILLEEAKITKLELLSEIPYDEGCFQYYSVEFTFIPESPVENAHGMVLNSKEILAKAGINDNLIVLYYNENDEIFEVSFIPEKRMVMTGYKNHVENRYRNLRERYPMEEYSFIIGGKKLTLWENLKGEKPVTEAARIRRKAEGIFAQSAKHIEIFECGDVEVSSWVQFEKKRELLFNMKALTNKVETSRGIRIGNTVEELKEKYPMYLAYLEDFDERGPAYGYIPDDDTNRYIAFRVHDKVISEMIIADGFDERYFIPKDGYVDQDVPWESVDYATKLTEKYARALYLGRHKADLESRQVFSTFVANNFEAADILDKGLWRDYSSKKEQLYFVIYKKSKEEFRYYIEVRLRQIAINTFTNDTNIWVVTHYRSQKKRG